MLRSFSLYYLRNILSTFGFCWLIISIYNEFLKTIYPLSISCYNFILTALLLNLMHTLVDGLFFSGFLRNKIELSSNLFDSKIIIKFGNIFNEPGCRVLAVNDFFDSIVDDIVIAHSSLHGQMLTKFWPGNTSDWDQQVSNELSNTNGIHENKGRGKTTRYPIGTSVHVKTANEQFVCVAASKTNPNSFETKADVLELQTAVTEAMKKSRSVCANKIVSIPLMGAGLSRVGLKSNMLANIILMSIFEEAKKNKISERIQLILPSDKRNELSLLSFKRNWR